MSISDMAVEHESSSRPKRAQNRQRITRNWTKIERTLSHESILGIELGLPEAVIARKPNGAYRREIDGNAEQPIEDQIWPTIIRTSSPCMKAAQVKMSLILIDFAPPILVGTASTFVVLPIGGHHI